MARLIDPSSQGQQIKDFKPKSSLQKITGSTDRVRSGDINTGYNNTGYQGRRLQLCFSVPRIEELCMYGMILQMCI